MLEGYTPLKNGVQRMDAGNDSVDNVKVCRSEDTKADFIIKRNLRRDSPEVWLLIAQRYGMCCEARPGKKIYRGSILSPMKGFKEPVRLVFEVIERTIDLAA